MTFAALSPTEQEIVQLRCEHGMSLDEVAAHRRCSAQTVKNHMTSILRKTGHGGSNGLCYAWGYERGATFQVDGLRPGQV